MREIILIMLGIASVALYLTNGFKGENFISLLFNFILLDENKELQKKLKGNCPELERVENVYKIKQ